MAYETITVEPLTARIGGIVNGADLTKPVSQAQIDEIRAALLEHQVVFFRNQPLDLETHKAFGRRFGEQYETYRRAVPAWRPRRHPWEPL